MRRRLKKKEEKAPHSQNDSAHANPPYNGANSCIFLFCPALPPPSLSPSPFSPLTSALGFERALEGLSLATCPNPQHVRPFLSGGRGLVVRVVPPTPAPLPERTTVAPAPARGFSDPPSSTVPLPCESGEKVELLAEREEKAPGEKELMREEEGREEGELSWRMTREFSLRWKSWQVGMMLSRASDQTTRTRSSRWGEMLACKM